MYPNNRPIIFILLFNFHVMLAAMNYERLYKSSFNIFLICVDYGSPKNLKVPN